MEKKFNEKIPKKLGLVVVSKEKATWIKVRDNSLTRIAEMRENIMVDRGVVEMAEEKIKKLK